MLPGACYLPEGNEGGKSVHPSRSPSNHARIGYNIFVLEALPNESASRHAPWQAFEVFVNKEIGKTTTAELLSNFCDNLLKKSGERCVRPFVTRPVVISELCDLNLGSLSCLPFIAHSAFVSWWTTTEHSPIAHQAE